MKLEKITALEKLYNLLFGFVAIRPSVRSQISEKHEVLTPSLTVFDTHYLNINWNVNEEDGTHFQIAPENKSISRKDFPNDFI